MNLKKLNNKIRKVWFIRGLIACLPLIALYVVLIFAGKNEGFMIPAIVSGGIVFIILAFLLIGIPLIRYYFYSYGSDEKRIYINHGIIFRHRIVIPVCQIQDLHLVQGPLLMAFKLGGIIISTAGSTYSISGIEIEECKKLINDLEEKLEERVEALKNE